MKATKTIVIYRPLEKIIIAEVLAGENYYLPTNGDLVEVFYGDLNQFLIEHQDYILD